MEDGGTEPNALAISIARISRTGLFLSILDARVGSIFLSISKSSSFVFSFNFSLSFLFGGTSGIDILFMIVSI